MGTNNNSNIVTNGLVFNYDMNSLKSYKGPVGTNILQAISPDGLGVSGNNYRVSSGTEDVFIPSIGFMPNVPYVDVMNDYNNSYGEGGSGNCCPRIFWFGNGVSVSPNTTYTYAIVYKATSGYTNANYMYQYHFTASNGSYVTEFGLHDTNKRVHLGDGWYWAWNTFTTGSTVNWIGTMGMWHYEYRTYTRVYVAKAMMIQGDRTVVHPRYWPNVNTTRSNTQAIIDLTNNNTITASSLTYESDGTFSFNGSNNNLSIGSFGGYSTNITCEAWFKTASSATWKNIICGPTNDLIFTINGSLVNFGCQGSSPIPHANYSTTTVNTGNWFHAIATYDGSVVNIYVNGKLESTNARTGSITPGAKNIGSNSGGSSEYFNGTIGSVKIYNRALSATEVLQNFIAQRGIYGI